MNKTIHTLTTNTIMGEGQAGDTKDVEGGIRTRRHQNILLRAGLAAGGDGGKNEW